jgi:hypothetical protein
VSQRGMLTPGWAGLAGRDGPPLSGGPGQIIRCWSDLLADIRLAADVEAVAFRIPIIPSRAWTAPREAAPVARQRSQSVQMGDCCHCL